MKMVRTEMGMETCKWLDWKHGVVREKKAEWELYSGM